MLNISLQNNLFEQIKKESNFWYTMKDPSMSIDAEIEILDNGKLKVYGKGAKKYNAYIKGCVENFEEYTKLFANKKESIEIFLENIQIASKGKITFDKISLYIENNIVKCHTWVYEIVDTYYTQRIGTITINTNTFEIEEYNNRKHEEEMNKFLIAYNKYINSSNETLEHNTSNIAITQINSPVPQTLQIKVPQQTKQVNQPRNKIIELVPSESIKAQLYETLRNNNTIGYTYNLRGIPGAIYSNYDINDRLFIVINPTKLQTDYVDYYIYPLDIKVKELYSSDIKKIENLYHNDHNKFIRFIKEVEKNRITQYSAADIEKSFIQLFNDEKVKSTITEPIIKTPQTQEVEIKDVNFAITG